MRRRAGECEGGRRLLGVRCRGEGEVHCSHQHQRTRPERSNTGFKQLFYCEELPDDGLCASVATANYEFSMQREQDSSVEFSFVRVAAGAR